MNTTKFLWLLIGMLSIYNCSAQQKTNKVKMQIIQPQQPQNMGESIAPGTCNLRLTDCKFSQQNKNWVLTGIVKKVLDYGSGVAEILNNKDTISLKVDNKFYEKYKKATTIICNVSCHNTLGGGVSYQLNAVLPDKKQ